MGVHNLWELLAPVGRRVSVETLAGKKLAIDASIWLVQFMKAMRDEKGEMVRNAHLLGFFRRICKLLFLRTKPVFVFDGGTPALKRRTVIARRRQRENAQAKIRKTAEKLLLNHLKSMRLKELANDLESQRLKNDTKGKGVVTSKSDIGGNKTASTGYNQEELDEMLAASLAVEGDEDLTGTASTSGGASASGAAVFSEDDDGDEDEEMILPALHGQVDPAVLASLPPSMQLDLLVQMRERLMAENRQKYQKVKKAPAKFSELQIQAYLKTVAFRREIDEVQKSASGRGMGGVKTSRIASEANREFIFSSSYSGNRKALTSAGVEGNHNEQRQIPSVHPSAASIDGPAAFKNLDSSIELAVDEDRSQLDKDVETYLDERGRVRVSKVRAMGIRMTRDLQRNLDLMKEIEQQSDQNINPNDSLGKDAAGASEKLPVKSQLLESLHQEIDGTVLSNIIDQESIPITGTSMELSFEDDTELKCVDSDDDLFVHIVAGDPVINFSADNSPLMKLPTHDSDSDCEWEEGVVEDITVGTKPSPVEGGVSGESDVEWENGSPEYTENASLCEAEYRKTVSKGAVEEAAEFQEAIRRSIEDLRCENNVNVCWESKQTSNIEELVCNGANSRSVNIVEDKDEQIFQLDNVIPPNESLSEVKDGDCSHDNVGELKLRKTDDPPLIQLGLIEADLDNMEMQIDDSSASHLKCSSNSSAEDKNKNGSSQREDEPVKTDFHAEAKGVGLDKELQEGVTVASQHEIGDASYGHSSGGTQSKDFVDIHPGTYIDDKRDFLTDEKNDSDPNMREGAMDEAVLTQFNEKVGIVKANLEEEMMNLAKERTDLDDEQRKLERNAESVSSEMFAECQELLQMFGLPYIIAPMEAEAQCAYLELENLVDGVVTDDSDVFLFGARSVYKNIFDERKYVETYFMKDIENELGLSREKLIRIALLLGSDYTEGVSGIGIVNAIEVLNAFPEEDGLHNFREWVESPDPTILGKVDSQAGSAIRKQDACGNAEDVPSPIHTASKPDDVIVKQIFMDKHRNVSKNWNIPSSFPSEAVISAYTTPQVDKSKESFSWGKPDLFVLRKLCWENFGWSTQKSDELLQPVLKEYNKHETQLRLEAFYTFNERFAKIRSTRIKKAVKGITGSISSELVDDPVPDSSRGRKKRKVQQKESVAEKSALSSDAENVEFAHVVDKHSTKHGSSTRGGSRGRGRGQSSVKGKRKNNSNIEASGTSSGDGIDGVNEQETHMEQRKRPHEVRRSARARKAVNYTVDDFEIDLTKTNQANTMSDSNEGGGQDVFEDQANFVNTSTCPSGSNHEVLDPPNKARLSESNIELEGGFCVEDTEEGIGVGEHGFGQNDEILSDKQISTEYVKMGGGFCLEEDEVDDQSLCPEMEMNIEHPDPSLWSDVVEKTEKDAGPSQLVSISPKEGSNESPVPGGSEATKSRQQVDSLNATADHRNLKVASNKENVEDDFGMRPVSYLTPMPNLRRKRRKS